MRVVGGADRRGDGAAWGLPGSLLLHAPLIAAIAFVPVAAPMQPEPVAGIVVELLSAPPLDRDQSRHPIGPPAPPVTISRPAPIASPPGPPVPDRDAENAPTMVRPGAMLSAAVLADPRSRPARTALASMDDGERRIQLCNIEAMSQVHAWRDELEPDQIVAYATADVAVAGTTVSADGAAFRSGGRWFALKYRCGIAAGEPAVEAFEFLVGDAVPKGRWEDYGLPDDADGAAPLD